MSVVNVQTANKIAQLFTVGFYGLPINSKAKEEEKH